MNDGLKQRLVGALVIIALGVIFIPVIFDRERMEPVDRTSQIPEAPVIDVPTLPPAAKPPRPRAPEISGEVDGEFDIEAAPDERLTAPSAELSVDTDNKNNANTDIDVNTSGEDEIAVPAIAQTWVLQVASFTSDDRVDTLRAQLENLGYRNFKREVETKEGKRKRIYVGPSADKQLLLDAKSVIDKRFKVESLILRYRS